MTSFRWTLVIAIVVAALVAFTVYDSKRSGKEEEAKQQELTLFKFKPAEIAKIEITSIYGEKVLEKKSDRWQLLAPMADLADEQTVQGLLSTFAAEKSLATVAEKPDVTADATYGFDAPISSAKLTATDGRTEELKVGRVKAYDGSLYVRIDKDPKVLLAGSALGNQLEKSVGEFRDKHLYRPKDGKDLNQVTRFEIRLNDPANKTWPPEIALAKDGENWKMTKGLVGDADFPVLADKVQSYIEQIKATRALSFVSDPSDKTKSKPKVTGLDKPAIDVRLYSEKAKEPFFRIDFAAPQGKEPNIFAKSSDVESVANVYKSGVETLKKHVDDFLDKKYPFDFKTEGVTHLKIVSQEANLELVHKGLVWEPVEAGLRQDIDSAKVTALIDKLRQIEAVRVLEPLKKGQTNPKLKKVSSLVLSQDSGEPVFEFSWGDAIIEKANAGVPESKYYPARTSRVDRMVGVSEFSIRGLELGSLIKKPQASPSPSPKAGSAPHIGSSP